MPARAPPPREAGSIETPCELEKTFGLLNAASTSAWRDSAQKPSIGLW